MTGALTVTGAFLVFVWAIVEVAVAAVLLALFGAVERTVEQPLVHLGILRSAMLVRANVGSLLLLGCAAALNFVTTLYLQDALGWGPLRTGLIFMASTLVTAVVAPHAGALATRIGAAPILLAGAVATAASTLVFLDTLAGVRDGQQGLASGLVGSSFQIGGAIVLATATAAMLAHTPAHATAVQNVHGLAAGVYVTVAAAGLLVLLALVGLFADRRRVNALELVTLDRAA